MIEVLGVKKSFGGVRALRGVNMEVKAGEIHALLGENGAGKSTLMKIISGAISRDEGVLKIDGDEVYFKNTQAAKEKGIGIIYQEFSLVPELSVAENIFLHQLKNHLFIPWKKLRDNSRKLIAELGFELDVRKKVKDLSIADQQIVEISKALSEEVRLLILDEPSAVLGPAEIHKLFRTLRALQKRGVAIIYISHHLEELFELSDKITVLKDGVSVATVSTGETTKDQLVELMLGRSLNTMFPDRTHLQSAKHREVLFSISGIRVPGSNDPVSLKICSGEIVGVGGLVGSGRTELLRAIFGADPQSFKKVTKRDAILRVESPKAAVRSGIGMVPEDRKQHGGILECSIRENISVANYPKLNKGMGFIRREEENAIVAALKEKLNIKMVALDQALKDLSGGNQQKVILAKWLNTEVELLLIDEPTRGVDVGARAEIYQIIHDLAESGKAILMVSSDWEELLGLPDRVIVMRKGTICGEVLKKDLNEEILLRMAIGEEYK
ncbi:sugar ABC transporter ATP-binding protein [Sinomicrobium sp.]